MSVMTECAQHHPAMTAQYPAAQRFFQRPIRCWRAGAFWVVAVAASVPLGSATSNVLGGCLLVTLLAAGGHADHWRRWRASLRVGDADPCLR